MIPGLSQMRLAGYFLAALALAALLTWHVTAERAERLAQIAQAVAEEQTKWVLEREAERARQAQVNREAQDRARAAIKALETANAALEADLVRMSDEAAQDPDRDRCGLGAGAAERLHRIR